MYNSEPYLLQIYKGDWESVYIQGGHITYSDQCNKYTAEAESSPVLIDT